MLNTIVARYSIIIVVFHKLYQRGSLIPGTTQFRVFEEKKEPGKTTF
jgi:hypothetical protein